MTDDHGFTCLHCGRTSHHPGDLRYRYCGACHHYCDDPDSLAPRTLPMPNGAMRAPNMLVEGSWWVLMGGRTWTCWRSGVLCRRAKRFADGQRPVRWVG